MKLTGKCKEEFEKWYEVKLKSMGYKTLDDIELQIRTFQVLDPSMKWGVIQDFADSEGYGLHVGDVRPVKLYGYSFSLILGDEISNDYTIFKTRPKARTAAIEKFNELYNA